MTALEQLRGLIVIDEVQRHSDLFPILRVLLDRRPIRARFLILSSASPELLRQSSETLAGRLSIVEMAGFTFEKLSRPDLNRLWLRGGFPRSFLARSEAASAAWREDFVRTFLERDLAQLGGASALGHHAQVLDHDRALLQPFAKRAKILVPLNPAVKPVVASLVEPGERSSKWKLVVNEPVEVDS